MASDYQMVDSVAMPGGILELGYDGPDVVMHVHGGRQARLTAEGRKRFLAAFAKAEQHAERERITALSTLQFHVGGLLDGEPADDYAVHLIRRKAGGGTPGPTLCGIDRFAPGSAGWSVGGGINGPDIIHKPCPGCAIAARGKFPSLPVTGIVGAKEMAAELGVEAMRHG